MSIEMLYTKNELHEMAVNLFEEERKRKRLDGWFIAKETAKKCDEKYSSLSPALKAAYTLREIIREMPITISEHAIFAGTQNDAFARSYALINPTFKVDSFTGYCDPTSVFNDIEPSETIQKERIESLRNYTKTTPYVKRLKETYEKVEESTSEAIFFIEQVTGHLIPDFQTALSKGVEGLKAHIDNQLVSGCEASKKEYYQAMTVTLDAVLLLAERYAKCAKELQKEADGKRKIALILIEETLLRVPYKGARNLYEAIQSFILLWEVMCLEQAPNPFAFSVGNADRIFEPYRMTEHLNRNMSSALFKHFLVFFNVGDRSWAISQNIMVGGKSSKGGDLTSESTYALLEAFYELNLPQPILSVKLHRKTPDALYRALGKFFFTEGVLTPSLFNDDSLFEVLFGSGIEKDDLENYAIAGCQEPLIMGKDNGNTTNSWLNLAKVLELTLNNGESLITGKSIGLKYEELGLESKDPLHVLRNIRSAFYKHLEVFINKMTKAANEASEAVALLPVPFLSAFMGGLDSGVDLRDTKAQGTKYNGSGCLIHGLSVVADSFVAIDVLLEERPEDAGRLIQALKTNFEQDEELQQYLQTAPKYGNNTLNVDQEAREIAVKVSDMIKGKKNYLGNAYRPDFSTPSTHLLYGHWVGATPDGRRSREMLGYGIDPLYGEAESGMGFRILSAMHLPFEKMNGGYASHFGIDPGYFKSESFEEKGLEFRNKVIAPLFFNTENIYLAPFYLYVNVNTPERLIKVLENPKKYAPSGVYIMRIHGTFVNFLDLSPEIQQDIIKRLDLKSTKL
ncbi:pyruvate formate lyase family protein [Cellulosilyticum sp. I15G10I2]|uniref:pyruvate formate lyase family protein n=1 Tax=Cellulosilyticum sp. I15G10I2 TaxID=1892843 RepID=UPI00085CA7D5|nr:pyruvate formate lyase family protein [Cellulosilyticum sp. I15G10I2]